MSSNFNKTQTVIVNSTATMPTAGNTANPTNVTNGQIALVGTDNTVITPGMTVSDHPTIRVVQGTSQGLKWSASIPGKQITGVSGRSFAAAQKRVKAIGYDRSAAAGSITATSSVPYEFSVVIKSDKQTFSQRLGKRTLSFKSSASATQLNIAVQIANTINNSTDLNRMLTAVIVGDGGSASGNTTTTISGTTYTIFQGVGASNYGVEVNGKALTQANGSYLQEIVDFEIELNGQTGFGAGAVVTNINSPSKGVGTYQSIYNAENFAFSVEGTINRTQFPIILPTAASSSTGVTSTTITPTVTATAGRDELVFSATVAGMLFAGDTITVGSTVYEIKYFQSTTTAIVVTTVNTSGAVSGVVIVHAGATVTKKYFYDIINIAFGNRNHNTGSGTDTDNLEAVMIAIPSIDASGAYNSTGTVAQGIMNALNPYINSVGLGSVTI